MSLGGYDNFKTPFYEIEIGDSTGKRLVKLPHHIMRLVSKVEIFESFQSEEHQGFTTINIVFTEGSREPASPDASLGTKGLYQIPISGDKVDMDIAGSLTNRTGVLSDLRFSGHHGITFLTESEKKNGVIDNTVQKNVVGKKTTRAYKKETKAPIFVFQERNQVKVTWGYLEDPTTVRSCRGYIIMVQSTFPDTSQPSLTITCQDTSAFLDQIAPTKGIPFGQRITTGAGNSLVIFKDLPTDTVIRNIADKAGMAVIISTNLPAPVIDKDKQKMWIAGESFNQFMVRLAEMHNCYYKVVPDPKTGKDTLVFIKKTDFEGRILFKDTNLLNYRAPGSILKSVDIKVDFGGIVGNSQKSVDQDGKPIEDSSMVVQQFSNHQGVDTNKREELINANPTGNNPIPAAKGLVDNILDGEFTGTVDNSPRQDKSVNQDAADIKSGASTRLIQIDFTTIGYGKITPGVVEIRGVGVRYSGKYRLMTVTHTLDSGGYITKCTGTSQWLQSGGTKVTDVEKAKETETITLEQFRGSGPRQALDKMQGTK